MSNRIDTMFAAKQAQGKKALITFVTAGDPNLDTTKQLVLAMEQSGADLIELGVPYSDPVAEGPVIQAANVRALQNDVRLDTLFRLVAELRNETQVPLVFLMYYNCIFRYDAEAFFARCASAGLDGVIVPDLPYEEQGEIRELAEQYNVHMISLIAPTSGARAQKIAATARGFLYCVSSLGVTGVRGELRTDFADFFRKIDPYRTVPTAIGFGISQPEQVRALKGYSDGIIVGSAIVRLVAEGGQPQAIVERVSKFVRALRTALDD